MQADAARRECSRSKPGAGSQTEPRPGLTLIELILVMVLLLLVLAMVAPRLDGFSRGRVLVGHAETVLAMLQTARDRSAAEAVPYRLQVDVESGACRLYRQAGGQFEPLADRPGGWHTLPEGIHISIERLDLSGADFVEFRPTGECTPASVQLMGDDRPPVVLTARTALEPFRLIEPGREDLP